MTPANTTNRFMWNVGGWFGSQWGCTLWLMLLGVVLMAQNQDPLAGVVCLSVFGVLNIAGLVLWFQRERLSAYTGIQTLLSLVTVGVLVVVLVVNRNGQAELPEAGEVVSTYLPYWVVFMGPILMLFFAFLQMEAKKKATTNIEATSN